MENWKKLTNPDYIGAYYLDKGDGTYGQITVRIKSVGTEMVNSPDGKKSQCIVAQLEGHKPLILNKTNCKAITKAYNTRYIDEWVGKFITITVAQVKAFGDVTDAIRVLPEKPKQSLPELAPTHAKWAGAIQSLKSGQVTIEKIKKSFYISEANQQLLIDAAV